jgi:hypothetical protein
MAVGLAPQYRPDWPAAGAQDHLAAASEVLDLTRAVGDDARERHGFRQHCVKRRPASAQPLTCNA